LSLQPGTRLGPYEIGEPLGAGGMGEVYRARDTRLDRTIAIKVLPAHLSSQPELRARLDREARTISSLNHPHICALHDIGSQDGVDFLVMEYLDGETLADRLSGKPGLPIDQALQIGMQIADALDKAHRQGVVHRDLKPGNIMIVRSGGPSGPPIAKLLDFGLARQAQPAITSAGQSMMPTNAQPITAAGTILGTLQYMAPEQLEGREADARTDIFAFGTVLYEMATGRRAFEAKSQVSLIAAIIDHDPPPVSSLVPVSPRLLDHVVRNCLAKDPEARWQSMTDVLLELRLIAGAGAELTASGTGRPARSRLTWLAAPVAGVLLLVAGALIAVTLAPGAPSPAKLQFDLTPPHTNYQTALSPGGTHLVAPASGGLWLRALANTNDATLPGTAMAQWPFWSADGRHVAFFAGGKLKRVDLLGAPAATIADAEGGSGGTWNREDVIVFASKGSLLRVSAAGGVATPLTTLDAARSEIAHLHPWFLPDGKHFLYLAVSSKPENSGIFVATLDAPHGTLLVNSAFRAAFAPPDHLLFVPSTTNSIGAAVGGGRLVAQRFDPDRLELGGEPFPVAEDVGMNSNRGLAGFTVSDTGMLAYRTAGDQVERPTTLKWFDRQGKASVAVETPAEYGYPVLSPDGQRLVVGKVVRRGGTPSTDLWILDLARATSTKLTFDAANDDSPRWFPDGSRIAFTSNRVAGVSDLYEKGTSGLAPEAVLLKSERNKQVDDVSADGRFLLYREEHPETLADLWVLPLTGERKPQAVVRSPFADLRGRFSPDGRWVAYESSESGRREIYLVPFPNATTRIQISTAGGTLSRWRRDGKEFFYMVPQASTSAVMAVDIDLTAAGAPRVGLPRKLFDVPAIGHWDVSPDGQRFLIIVAGDQTSTAALVLVGNPAQVVQPIRVILNWNRRSPD
jgi:Tol biopolymer transport system component